MHPAALPEDELLAECEIRFTRRSGPGGQHRNKVETAVIFTHAPSGLQAEANERRSQSENRRAALFRLRLQLALSVRTPRGDDQPSELWKSRCPAGRITVSPQHDDFPALLAEALDVLAACDHHLPPAAEQLSCTSSQLTKFLKLEPAALSSINQHRLTLGLRPLR